MIYCVTCEMNMGNIELLKKDGKTVCPKCNSQITEITSTKLESLVTDISNAFNNMRDSKVQSDAQKLIKNARVIEIGEKKLKKEYLKHEKALKELQYELSVIKKIAEKVNYKF